MSLTGPQREQGGSNWLATVQGCPNQATQTQAQTVPERRAEPQFSSVPTVPCRLQRRPPASASHVPLLATRASPSSKCKLHHSAHLPTGVREKTSTVDHLKHGQN